MSIITKKHLSRRMVLKGFGVSVALPVLDAMIPAGTAYAKTAVGASSRKTRLIAIEQVHGAAGSTKFGLSRNMWSPAAVGSEFDLSPTSLSPLDSYRNDLTIISNTDVRNAEPQTITEFGGDHFRASAVFLTQSHVKQTEGSDVYAGTSLDQLYAQTHGQDTPIPSMQLAIESVDQAGGCAYGYSCVYTDTISWASPTQPMPMIRDPRAAFDQLFGIGATAAERRANREADRSILDWVSAEVAALSRRLSARDRSRLTEYLDDIREIERRIQRIEAQNRSGETRALPDAPIGVPDSFTDHVKLMFDLQAVAFASDVTRVFSFKLGRDGSSRSYPESGTTAGFHPASHHGDKEDKIIEFEKINKYHVGLMPYLFDKLKNTADGDGNLLDKSLIIYGSPMGDPNVHNHKRCPLFLAGHANGRLKGNLHLKAADGTSMANVMLSIGQTLDLEIDRFGDSSAPFDLNAMPAPATTSSRA